MLLRPEDKRLRHEKDKLELLRQLEYAYVNEHVFLLIEPSETSLAIFARQVPLSPVP